MSSLTEEVENAIVKPEAPVLNHLIEICDSLHKGIAVDGYAVDDIPPDHLYEQMKQKLEELKVSVASKIATARKPPVKKSKTISDIHMAKDAIIKKSEALLEDTTVVCMPKYDGVSCAVRFVWDDETNQFEIDEAQTRGTDVGLTHKTTDMKDRMNQLLESDTCKWFKHFQKLHKKYKSITVRGEVVLIDKTKLPAAPYVSGKINSKSKVFDEEGVIGFKMFEITRLIDLENVVSVPSQRMACKLISQVDSTIPYEVIDLTTDATDELMEIYNGWVEDLDSPIDGVVYCEPSWKYPQTEAESKGVNYGKYALKPNLSTPSTFESIEYGVGKDGKLNPVIFYKQVTINGKKYNKASCSISALYSFINDKHIGPGSTVELQLRGSLIPHISSVVADTSGEPIALIDKCPECGSDLSLKHNKDIVTLTCLNIACPGILITQLVTLFKTLKLTGFAEKTIMKLLKENDNDYQKLFPAVDIKKGKDFVRSHIRSCLIGDLIYGLNISTRAKMKNIDAIADVITSKVSDEMETVKAYITTKPSVLVNMILPYL